MGNTANEFCRNPQGGARAVKGKEDNHLFVARSYNEIHMDLSEEHAF